MWDCHSVVEPKISCRGGTVPLNCTEHPKQLLPRRFAPALANPTLGHFHFWATKKATNGLEKDRTSSCLAYNTRLCHCGSNTLPDTSMSDLTGPSITFTPDTKCERCGQPATCVFGKIDAICPGTALCGDCLRIVSKATVFQA